MSQDMPQDLPTVAEAEAILLAAKKEADKNQGATDKEALRAAITLGRGYKDRYNALERQF